MGIDTEPSADAGPRQRRRDPWLGLAAAGPVTAVATRLAPSRMDLTADPTAFAHALVARRPRIVVLASPPADAGDLELVLAERRRYRALRIVHVSAVDAVAARLAAIEAGVDDAVADSIDPGELLGRLELLAARPPVPSARELAVTEDVVLDLVAHEARRDGRQLHLRPKEFQLLAMLAADPGRAYTRRQILDRVWGLGHDGDPRTVDVHVRWLRSKLEPRDEPTHLVTVRGFGYRLDPWPR